MADIIVLTKKQAEQYNNGLLTKSLFKKLLFTEEFENYLYRYCKIINDFRTENNTVRETTFLQYNIEVTVFMKLGICEKVSYKEK